MPELPISVDLDRCWGCRTCETACALEKGIDPAYSMIKVETVRAQGSEPIPGSPQGKAYVPVLCQHCESPACAQACPSGALFKAPGGRMDFKAQDCSGCGACEAACPYGAIHMSPQDGTPGLCDLCGSRQEAGLLPACVQHCPGKALGLRPGPRKGEPDADRGPGGKPSWSLGLVSYMARPPETAGEP